MMKVLEFTAQFYIVCLSVKTHNKNHRVGSIKPTWKSQWLSWKSQLLSE